MTDQREGMVSVCLPVRNEERYLAECLDALLRQDCAPDDYEIVVADGRSTDLTPDILRRYAASSPVPLSVVDNPGVGVASGRNAAIRAARGEYIAFVEGHAVVPPGFVRDVRRLFADTGALCLGRCVMQDIAGDTPFQRATGRVRASRIGRNPHSLRFGRRLEGWVDPTTVATVYRREVFARFGLFDESFTTNEDVEFNWRLAQAGVKAYQSPALTYQLHPRATWLGLLRQMYRYGHGKARFIRKHPRAMRLAYAAPTLLLLAAAGLTAATFWRPWAGLPLLLGAALGTLTSGGRISPRALAVRAGMVVGFGAGFVSGATCSARSVAPGRAPRARDGLEVGRRV